MYLELIETVLNLQFSREIYVIKAEMRMFDVVFHGDIEISFNKF